jgi:hypothetical protein
MNEYKNENKSPYSSRSSSPSSSSSSSLAAAAQELGILAYYILKGNNPSDLEQSISR